ncbi:MAG: WbqC family protein [Bacteroidetes bacterium]|nr:WbqC family protein [Bacteroidota bacterium]
MGQHSSILLSTAYLPPIEFFVRILHADEIFIEKEETYCKQSYRNRCEIYSANGKLVLTVPVIKPHGNHTQTKDIEIENSLKWQKEHWRTIISAYNQSPYFLFYRDVFEPFYSKKFCSLWDFNLTLVQTILEILKADKVITDTDSFEKIKAAGTTDYRKSINPKISSAMNFIPYRQVFSFRHGFLSNLSIIDLIFNTGPDTTEFLLKH